MTEHEANVLAVLQRAVRLSKERESEHRGHIERFDAKRREKAACGRGHAYEDMLVDRSGEKLATAEAETASAARALAHFELIVRDLERLSKLAGVTA